MRLLILSFSLLAYSFTSCSQGITEAQVPSVVKNSLLAQYPEAKLIEWEKEKDLFEADFTIGQTEQSVMLDASGKVVLLKTEIPVADIPAAVLATITQENKNKTIGEVEKIDRNGEVFYEVELKGKPFGKEIVLNQNGLIEQNPNF